MFRMSMTGEGHAQAFVDNHIQEMVDRLARQNYVLLVNDASTFAPMARFEPRQSVLDFNCGSGDLLLDVYERSGETVGPLVGVDPDNRTLTKLSERLKGLSIRRHFRLFKADMSSLSNLAFRQGLALKQPPHNFDIIFAINALPPCQPDRVAALRRWAGLLTPATGRMVVAFRDKEGQLGEIAGSVRLDSHGYITHRSSFMMEWEWVRAESEFRSLASAAGLELNDMRRVGFHGQDATKWQDESAVWDQKARGRVSGNLSALDSTGYPTIAFKNACKFKWVEQVNENVMSEADEEVLVGCFLVAVLSL